MMPKLKSLLQSTMGRYVVIGGGVYVFELLVIVLMQRHGANALVAVGVSFWTGTALSFVLQKFVTFGDHRMQHIVLLQAVAAVALVIFNFVFTLLVTKLLSGIVPTQISRTIALGITVIWNFYLYRTRIFHVTPQEDIVLVD